MVEVQTRQELQKAIADKADIIHIADEKLSIGLITRPHKYRRLMLYATCLNGYRLTTGRLLGIFDVRFVRQK